MSLDANGESEPTGRVPATTVATSAVLPQYHHRGSCMSLDANGESEPTGRVPANTVATSAVLPQYHHRGSCMRRPPCRRNTITEVASMPTERVVAGLHFMLSAPAMFG